METYKVIIAGSREFENYEMLKRVCDNALRNKESMEIVSGKANGADELGEKYAKEKGHKIKEMRARWGEFGKSAGYRRNKEMAKYGDMLIAFWDGKSKGTKHMVNLAKEFGLKIKIVEYGKDEEKIPETNGLF